ncbi:InlB B-repeat-containing protein [Mediannikoviicoccus vaginalis]|uniref:InlB B-repeat-containing protein n=1 Tax=Mediannikoviicoccus vaginalis TaxID=2899727 RepID=UPI0021029278|nr:InlB B-repeat-containing protein [Mediannikoviicoccus vaginalis]
MKGGPGNLYHYKARFNEMMYKWPNDAKQTKGFTPGYQSFGWGPNYSVPNWPKHLDTPPYRLNAEEFLDMGNYTDWGGYTKKIDKGDGTTMDLDRFDFTTLSFGIKQDKPSIPHHMDFWMDGFKDGETIIRYDLVRTKADTSDPLYGHRYPRVQGFTPYGYDPKKEWPVIREGQQDDGRVDEDRIDELNDERDEINPNNSGTYYNNNGIKLPIGQLDFIPAFFSDTDEYGDPLGGEKSAFKENGYLQFHYKRNKYPLRFNYDPSKIKDDSEFNSTNQLDTFYEFPLKALSPDVDSNDEYKKVGTKEGPKNLLDNPGNLQKLGLTDLVFTDTDGKLKVKRPEGLSDQMVFKGWALDPAGTKLVWENKDETMPFHPVNLYAKWGEPDYKWKVTFDPDGGRLKTIKEEKLTTERKKIQEGDIGQEEINTYAKKEENDGDKQVFTVIQRQKLVKPVEPVRKGYDFMGWEVIHYKKDEKTGDYTDEIDTSYRDEYGVPELYTFGNDVVSPIYLKAIWNPNQRVDVKVVHHFLDKDCKEDGAPLVEYLEDKRTGYYTATTGDQQGQKWILAPHEELEKSQDKKITDLYKKYNEDFGFNNTYFQNQRIEPEKIKDPDSSEMIANPNYKGNEFHFFYRPFRQREYKVNYIDERFKGKENEKDAAIIGQELVTNGNRHYDARNYRPIPGWVLTSDPQQQLFFDLNEETNEFLGINGTGKDEITFYYKDVRVIEVPGDKEPPEGYVRVTFKIDEKDKGGAFTDKDGKSVTELHYDVIDGLKSDLLPVPGGPIEESKKEEGKYYITPDDGKKFTKWDNSKLLNKNTIVDNDTKDFYVFTAYFEWSGLSAKGLVRTEAYKDENDKWTNDFAPKIEDLKKQLVWKEKDEVKKLPAGTIIEFFDEAGNKITTDDQVYNLVKEIGKADKEELVRTVNITAKVTFKDGKDPQELTIPIKVYKNVYEALNKEGDKPLFLKEAEGKEAKDGGLSDVTGDYVMVTIKASKDFNAKDDKIYYVNKNAWVEIPEVKTEGSSTFVNWTADKAAQNEEQAENGIFDFGKRHKFTEDTVISPKDAKDVVEQTDPKKKPDVPDSYVKVIVKTTDKATDATAFEKTFWVNPTKEVNLVVANPTGKSDQEVDIPKLGKKKVNYIFKEWQKVQTGEADDKLKDVTPAVKIDLAKNKFTDKVTVIESAYKKSIQPGKIEEPLKTTKLDTPQGKEITNEDLVKQITPQEGKEIKSIEVISKPDGNTVGNEPAKVIVKYKDGSTQGTNDNPVVIPVEVLKNIIPEAPGGQRPKDALDNYVKVIFKAGTGGTVSGDLVYYVSPEVEVDMTESAGKVIKTPDIGYFVNGENWTNKDNKALKETFTDPVTEFVFNFDKSDDIVEKIDDPEQVIPEGYVKVTFKTEDENKGKLEGEKLEKIYYVNPNAGITLKVLGEDETAKDKQLAVPTTIANTNYVFKEWQENIDENTPITSERVHVAIFQLGEVTLTYEKGGDDVTGDVPDKATAKYGEIVGLAGPGNLKKPKASFAGWKLDEDEKIYQPGEQVKLEKARTATAQWKTNSHTVTFDSKGGSNVDSQTVEHGQTANKPEAPKLDGKVFMGWKEKESDKDYFDFTTQITADKTLIAIWQDPVQKIGENDTVEEQFIKVTFLKGEHGTLKEGQNKNVEKVTYKVAKDYDFAKAVQAGLVVPGIVPDKYYKAKADNEGWDKALKLEKQNVEFTAQYEPEADVIPIEPGTSDEEIKKEMPEGMVLVTFVVPKEKAYMDTAYKFYVAKNKEVKIKPPVVYNKVDNYEFREWQGRILKDGLVVDTFKDNTTIAANGVDIPNMEIQLPKAGDKIVHVIKDLKGATGKLELTINGQETVLEPKVETKTRRKGRRIVKEKIVYFTLPQAVQSGDLIKYWAEKDGIKSPVKSYMVK